MNIHIKTPYLQDVVEIIDKDDPHTIEVHGKVYKQVVRCKDCAYWLDLDENDLKEGCCYCTMNDIYFKSEEFCSRGARKESEE